MKRRRGCMMGAVLVVSLLVCLPGASFADDIGTAAAMSGSAKIRKGDQPELADIKKGDPVALGDTVQSDEASKILLKLNDGSFNSLGEQSEIYLYDFAKEGPAEFYGGDLSAGIARFIKKLPQTDPPSSYTVTTSTASIEVEPTERAADFVVQVFNEKQTTVTVIWGRVIVKNIREELTEERIVESCQQVDVDADKNPSPVVSVSSRTLKDLIELTTIPRTLPEDVPDCDREVSYYEGEPPDIGVDVYCPPDIPWVPPGRCRECTVWNGKSCVPCKWVGMECYHGRCVRKDCPRCTFWNGKKCLPCNAAGLSCKNGRCVPKPCKQCTTWNGRRCVPCRELGMQCVNGKCVKKPCAECRILRGHRCVPCRELGLACEGGRCVRKHCGNCTVWNGRRCVSCKESGRVCVGGRCVIKHCPQCKVWNGQRCVSCAELGRVCVGGKCVTRPCKGCRVRKGDHCVSCSEVGMECHGGRCVGKQPLKPKPKPEEPPKGPGGVIHPKVPIHPVPLPGVVPSKPEHPRPVHPRPAVMPGKTTEPKKPIVLPEKKPERPHRGVGTDVKQEVIDKDKQTKPKHERIQRHADPEHKTGKTRQDVRPHIKQETSQPHAVPQQKHVPKPATLPDEKTKR